MSGHRPPSIFYAGQAIYDYFIEYSIEVGGSFLAFVQSIFMMVNYLEMKSMIMTHFCRIYACYSALIFGGFVRIS